MVSKPSNHAFVAHWAWSKKVLKAWKDAVVQWVVLKKWGNVVAALKDLKTQTHVVVQWVVSKIVWKKWKLVEKAVLTVLEDVSNI